MYFHKNKNIKSGNAYIMISLINNSIHNNQVKNNIRGTVGLASYEGNHTKTLTTRKNKTVENKQMYTDFEFRYDPSLLS